MGDSTGGAKSGDKAEKAIKSQKTDEDRAFDDLFAKDNAFEKATGRTFDEIQKQGFSNFLCFFY